MQYGGHHVANGPGFWVHEGEDNRSGPHDDSQKITCDRGRDTNKENEGGRPHNMEHAYIRKNGRPHVENVTIKQTQNTPQPQPSPQNMWKPPQILDWRILGMWYC